MRALFALLLLLPTLVGCLGFHQGPMPGEPKDATYAEIEGVRVRYTDRGKGSPVVLVHGFASSLETWAAVAPQLEREHRVITLDLKGFGWTDRPPGDYSPAAQARLVWKLLDQRGVSKVAVVGHSWGASVSLAMALGDPARVTKLALYDAWIYEEQLPTFFVLARTGGVGEALFGLFYDQRPDERISLAFYDPRVVNEKLVEEVEKALERPGTKAAALAAVRGQNYAAVQGKYRTIQTPTLLLWGREDLVTPVAVGERLASDLPSSELVVYPRCGHFPMLEAVAASNRKLFGFLRDAADAADTPPVAQAPSAPVVTPAPATEVTP